MACQEALPKILCNPFPINAKNFWPIVNNYGQKAHTRNSRGYAHSAVGPTAGGAQSAGPQAIFIGRSGTRENVLGKKTGCIYLRLNFAFALLLPSKCRVCNRTYPPPPPSFSTGNPTQKTHSAGCPILAQQGWESTNPRRARSAAGRTAGAQKPPLTRNNVPKCAKKRQKPHVFANQVLANQCIGPKNKKISAL